MPVSVTADVGTGDDERLERALRDALDAKAKPPGSLGRLEDLAVALGLAQRTPRPCIDPARVVVFAADHGVAKEGVSAYPAEVTAQMIGNFVAGGAAVAVLADMATFADAGVSGAD